MELRNVKISKLSLLTNKAIKGSKKIQYQNPISIKKN